MNTSLSTPNKPHEMTTAQSAFLAAGICLLLLAGCKSRSDNDLPSVTGAQATGDWLCDAGKATDDWDCIQSENIEPLLKERQAQEIPPAPKVPQPGAVVDESVVDPNAGQSILDALSQPTPLPQGPLSSPPPPNTEPAQPPAPPQSSSTRQSGAPLTTATRTEPQEPAYAQLAYRPADPVRIIDLPEDFYAAQLLAVSTKKQIEDFVVEKDLYNMSAARIERDGAVLYVLLLGVYESKEIALAAVAKMPDDVRTLKPWVRPIDGLQDAMMRADRLSATADAR